MKEAFHPLVHSPNGLYSWGGPAQATSQEAVVFWISHVGAEAQALRLSAAAFLDRLEGSWIKSGATGITAIVLASSTSLISSTMVKR